MIGEVRNLEVTINVRINPLPVFFVLIVKQNFFTTVKALVNQASGEGMVSDGHHHFEQPEQELLSGYVIFVWFKLDLTPPHQSIPEPIFF